MAIVTIADVLRHAERFEQMLAGYYNKVAHETTRDGVRLLTEYMSRHRNRIAEALDKMDPSQVRLICCSEVRYEPHAADCQCFENLKLPKDADAARILDAAISFDECLIDLYNQTARQTNDPHVKDLFESLIKCEQRDEIELKKIKAMDYF